MRCVVRVAVYRVKGEHIQLRHTGRPLFLLTSPRWITPNDRGFRHRSPTIDQRSIENVAVGCLGQIGGPTTLTLATSKMRRSSRDRRVLADQDGLKPFFHQLLTSQGHCVRAGIGATATSIASQRRLLLWVAVTSPADKSMVDFKRLFDTSMTAGHASQGRPRIPDHRIARKRGQFLARIIAIGVGIVKRFGRHDHVSLQCGHSRPRDGSPLIQSSGRGRRARLSPPIG